tara:strand:+ start:286 stop:498 length:213 start_codon:yes stop_codon:yes gene_type:complete
MRERLKLGGRKIVKPEKKQTVNFKSLVETKILAQRDHNISKLSKWNRFRECKSIVIDQYIQIKKNQETIR